MNDSGSADLEEVYNKFVNGNFCASFCHVTNGNGQKLQLSPMTRTNWKPITEDNHVCAKYLSVIINKLATNELPLQTVDIT